MIISSWSPNKRFIVRLALLVAAAAATRAAAAPWVAGYYTGWEQSQLPFSSVDLTAMDAVIDFAVVPSATGALDNGVANEMSVNMASRVAAVHAAGKKILYTVGGVGTQAAFEGAMSSTYRAAFVSNLVNFMTANDYDGIDLDMEEMSPSDVAPYVVFATALRAQMSSAKAGSLLTAAATWDPSAFAQLDAIFDHVDLETYSLSGTWYNETWHNAPVYSTAAIPSGTLPSVDSMVRQFETAGVSAAKLGVGITFDPYVWTGGSGVTKPQETWTGAPSVSETYYYAIAKTYGLVEGATTSDAGSVYGWDASAQAAYLSVTGSPASNDAFVSYDDVSAIDAKIAYAAANGIGSVIIWDLAGGWRADLPAGQQGRLLAAIKSAAYGTLTSAPIITDITAGSIGPSSATVAWTTNEPASSQVEYGLTANYGQETAFNASLTTGPIVVLSGLNPGTLYHYAVMSGTAAGIATISADNTLTTANSAAPPVISSVTTSGIGQASATIGWITNEPATTQVQYGVSSAYGMTTTLDNALTTGHGAVLGGLNPGTLYHYSAVSADASGALAASSDATFTAVSAVLISSFSDDFSSYALNACVPDGAAFGPWTSAFSGYGCTQLETAAGKFWLEQTPQVSTAASLTHAALVLGPAFAAPVTVAANVFTNAQLRRNGAPNPWEVGWILWDYTDNQHFYSFTPQTNGWVLGKEDPAYPGSQRFLASGSSPVFPIGAWYAVKIAQTGNVITVYVNGQLITTYTDLLAPYSAGNIGLYNEDSDVRFENVAVDIAPPVISSVAAYALGQSSATVSWTTNEAADSQVEYGLTAAYASTTSLNSALTTGHAVLLGGLNAGAVYHYAVMSHDVLGELTTSPDSTFASLPAPSTGTPVMTGPFVNNFSSSTLDACFADGSAFGPWTSAFGGYGCTQVQSNGARFWLAESPLVSTAAALTHSALVLGPAFVAPLVFSADLQTTAQLRKNAPPNPWEVGWLVWDYADNNHFYYFQLKPNGWELGKEDPAYPGSQRFLATGTSPTFPIGAWAIVKIVQTQNVITVSVNGQTIVAFTDSLSPYTSGNIGLYAEDSAVRFANVAVNAPAGGAAPTVAVVVPGAGVPPAGIATISGATTLLALTSDDADVALVQFLLDAAPLGAPIASPPFSMSWNASTVAPGAHSLGAVLWDAAGDSSLSPVVPVIVDALAAGAPADQAKAPQRFLSPALPDGINDAATFGPSATDVSVYDVRGRLVFHGSQQGGAPIVWNCKDGSGRVDESGVYIAKIKTAGSGVLYQSFALVK